MQNIILIGTGGLMKEQIQWLDDVMDFEKKKYNIILCSEKKVLKNYDFIPEKKIKKNLGKLYLAVGDSEIRLKLILKFKKYEFFSLRHPTAIISKNAKIGKGVTISPRCIIAANTIIGDFNHLNCGANIYHDCKVGNNNIFSPGTQILGNCKIGNSNFFGTNSCMKPGIKIGNFNTIGASSFLNSNLDNKIKVGGIPAKKI